MPVDLVIKNGKIVTHDSIFSGGIAVNEGKIVAVCKEPHLPQADRIIDAKERYVIPGLVDPHLHIGHENYGNISDLAKYKKYESDCRTETQAAAAGGVTVVAHFVLEPKVGILKMFDKYKETYERQASVDGFFHAFIVSDVLKAEVGKLPEVGITSFKLLTGYKGPSAEFLGIEPVDDGDVVEVFDLVSRMPDYPGKKVMVHAEDIDIHLMLRSKVIAEGRNDLKAWHDSRPGFIEEEIMRRTIFFSKITGCPLYIVHVTTGEGMNLVAKAKAEGIDVVAETCPQFLSLNYADPYLNKCPPLGMTYPPLRSKNDNEKLWNGIRGGVIECVGSDHAGCTMENKGVLPGNTIWDLPMGTLGNITEMILPIMLSEGVNKGRIGIEKLVEVCCQNPARVFGLFPKKGAITVGSDADIVIIDINKKQKVSHETHHSFQDWNAWDGWELKGWPILTILRGTVMMEESQIIGKPGTGKYLPRADRRPDLYQIS